MSVTLYDTLSSGYTRDKNKQIDEMKKYGYYRDDALSKSNEQVYYNPQTKDLLVNVNGTNPYDIKDIKTDFYLGIGKLKDTDRYKEAKSTIDDAKKKYGTNATLTGHSLGGGIVNLAGSKNDKIITLDAGYTFGQTARKNVKNYRTEGDIVSVLSPWSNTQTLKNDNKKLGNPLLDGLIAHNVSNIKNQQIVVGKKDTTPINVVKPTVKAKTKFILPR